jgi:hypothetical protein
VFKEIRASNLDAIWTPRPLPRLLDSEIDQTPATYLRLESTDYVASGDSRAPTRAVIWPSIFLLLDEEFGFLYRDAPRLPGWERALEAASKWRVWRARLSRGLTLVIHVLLRARSYGLPFSSCWTENLVFYIGTLPCSQTAGDVKPLVGWSPEAGVMSPGAAWIGA